MGEGALAPARGRVRAGGETVRLVTGCNEHYYPRMQSYLQSLHQHADFRWQMVAVGFDPHQPWAVTLRPECNPGAPAETESIQHGSFLEVIETDPEEVIVYTDGDFVMQRPMDDDEREFLDLEHGQVVTGYNFGEHCTLFHDAHLLSPFCTDDRLLAVWGDVIQTAQDYNAGFLAMTRQTWGMLHTAYMAAWDRVSWTFRHQARQQWLISYKIAALGFEVKLCPWSIHAHGHGGLKPGMERRDGAIWADGKMALFRHYL